MPNNTNNKLTVGSVVNLQNENQRLKVSSVQNLEADNKHLKSENERLLSDRNLEKRMRKDLGENREIALAENLRLKIALADAIRRPLGIVPDSAIEFLNEVNRNV